MDEAMTDATGQDILSALHRIESLLGETLTLLDSIEDKSMEIRENTGVMSWRSLPWHVRLRVSWHRARDLVKLTEDEARERDKIVDDLRAAQADPLFPSE